MTKTRVIRVFSFIMALTLVFAMCSAPSYAISPRQFGAWIASALTALNITAQSTIGPMLNWGNDFNDYLSAPFKVEGTQVIDVPYTWSDVEIDQYLQNSTISFTGDYIEIDGKHYQDVWLSNEAAEKFRVNAFDIVSAWNIASNSQGNYVSGNGFINDLPIFGTQNEIFSQKINVPYNSGTYLFPGTNIGVKIILEEVPNPYRSNYPVNGSYVGSGFGQLSYLNRSFLREEAQLYSENSNDFRIRATTSYLDSQDQEFTFGSNSGYIPNITYNPDPFDFDWVSGTIPADEQLPSTDGLHIYVPTDPSEWTDSPETQTIINNYNTYIDNNPDIKPDVDLDLNTPGILDKIGDLLDILGPIIDLMKPTFGPKGQEPTPPVPPEPGDTIANTPWESLVDWLQRILNKLEDLLGIKNILNDFMDVFDSNMFSILHSLSQVKAILNSILNALSDLVDTIVHGNVDWFSDVVDAIKKPFLKWLDIFKSGVSIWHYVVEWLQNISAPFSFFWNVLSSSYSIYLSPFYAVAAASIVIAIYRRFGR